MNRFRRPVAILALLLLTGPGVAMTQVYKWTDANGQVHYGQRKPDDATPVQTLDIAPPPSAATALPDPDAEVARIKALSEQMARERQAAEQARQEQAIRDLELANQQLQNDLLNQQLQQQQPPPPDSGNGLIIGSYPPFDPYPLYPPYPPHPPYPPRDPPPHPWRCEPWMACRQPLLSGTPPRPEPLAKPNPPFQPAPVRIVPQPHGVFRGR